MGSWLIFRFLRRIFGGVFYNVLAYSKAFVGSSADFVVQAMRQVLDEPRLCACLFFPNIVQGVIILVAPMGMPHWGPVVLWYAFLVYIFAGKGWTRAGGASHWRLENELNNEFIKWVRFVLPWVFMWEGVSQKW